MTDHDDDLFCGCAESQRYLQLLRRIDPDKIDPADARDIAAALALRAQYDAIARRLDEFDEIVGERETLHIAKEKLADDRHYQNYVRAASRLGRDQTAEMCGKCGGNLATCGHAPKEPR